MYKVAHAGTLYMLLVEIKTLAFLTYYREQFPMFLGKCSGYK